MYNDEFKEYCEEFLVNRYKSPDEYIYDMTDISFDGKVCAFTGHRPSKMPFFYGDSDSRCLALRAAMARKIHLAINLGYTDFITGMALGVDQWAAITVIMAKKSYPHVKLHAALPYLNQTSRWYGWQKDLYDDILRFADKVYVTSRDQTKNAPIIRNAFMIKHADLLIAVCDGTAGGTTSTVRMAEKKGIDRVIINPRDFI